MLRIYRSNNTTVWSAYVIFEIKHQKALFRYFRFVYLQQQISFPLSGHLQYILGTYRLWIVDVDAVHPSALTRWPLSNQSVFKRPSVYLIVIYIDAAAAV